MENEKIKLQTTFNDDDLDELVEEGDIEHVSN